MYVFGLLHHVFAWFFMSKTDYLLRLYVGLRISKTMSTALAEQPVQVQLVVPFPS
jgi:hypothetical protein